MFYSALVRPPLQHGAQFWSPQSTKMRTDWRGVQRRATTIQVLENLPWEESLRVLSLFTLEKIPVGPQHSAPVLKRVTAKRTGGSPLPGSHMEKRQGNRYKLHWERFHLGIKKKDFRVRTNNPCNSLPRGAGGTPIIGGLQDATGLGVGQAHPGSLCPGTAGPGDLPRCLPSWAVL